MALRFECAKTGIGNRDKIRHKYDNRYGEVLYIYQKANDNDDLLRFGCAPKLSAFDSFQIFAKVEFLIAWRFNGHPVICRYTEDIETFLLEKML